MLALAIFMVATSVVCAGGSYIDLVQYVTVVSDHTGSYMSPTQHLAIHSDADWWQEMFYNYDSGQIQGVTPPVNHSADVEYSMPADRWLGAFHYSYTLGAWSEARYEKPHVLRGRASAPSGSDWWQMLSYNYTTYALSVTPAVNYTAKAQYYMPFEQWGGHFLYSYVTGDWTEARYENNDAL